MASGPPFSRYDTPAGINPAGTPGSPTPWTDNDQALWEKLKLRPTKVISIVGLAAAKQLLGGACILIGFALRETSQAAAQVDLFDGADASGVLVAALAVVANGNASGGVGTDGTLLRSGLFFNRISGTWQGGIWVKT